MDANKLKVLQDLPYEIKRVCSNCEHADFPYDSPYGTCQAKTYQHLKHTGEARQLSIFVLGCCPDHRLQDLYKEGLGTWGEFVK